MFFAGNCFVASLAGLRCSSCQRVIRSRSSRASQRCTVRFMRARSSHYARGYSSVQHYSALVRPFQAQATTVSAVCQAGLALSRRCGLTIRSSGLPVSVRAKIIRRRRQPLNSSVRPHKRFLFSVRSLRHLGFCSLAAVASFLAWLACAAAHVSRWPALAVRARIGAAPCASCAPDRCATREVAPACSNTQPWFGRSRRRPQPFRLFARLGSRFSVVAA